MIRLSRRVASWTQDRHNSADHYRT